MKVKSRADAERYLFEMTPKLRGYLRVLLGDLDDAEDLLQEVFLKYLKKGPEPWTLAAERWLFRVSRNEALNAIRGRRRRKVRERVYEAAWLKAAADPSEEAGKNEAVLRMDACLKELPMELREMVCMKVIDGLSLREIAERTGVAKSTVAVKIQEGLVLLNRSFHGRS